MSQGLAHEDQAKRIFARFAELEAQIAGLESELREALDRQANAITAIGQLLEDHGRSISEAYGMAMVASGGPPEPED